ncbi:hypothetical protein DP73_07570 [Desulfosporosinus sp. HMP52]|nr:hypothetical protein DP73_07570 [Desulfosporosinus sp. HMP52]
MLLRSPMAPSLSPLIPKRAMANLWVLLHVNPCHAGASKSERDWRDSAKRVRCAKSCPLGWGRRGAWDVGRGRA